MQGLGVASVGRVCLEVEEVQTSGTVTWSFTYPLAPKGRSALYLWLKSEALREDSG